MKVIVAGSRTIHDYDVVKEAIENSGFQVDKVVSGALARVESTARRGIAEENRIPVQRFEPNTQKYRLGAWLREFNEAMASYADALVGHPQRLERHDT